MNRIKILAIGDVVGNTGLEALERGLSNLITKKEADFVVVNIENSADGLGVNKKAYERLKKLDIDVMTLRKSYMG